MAVPILQESYDVTAGTGNTGVLTPDTGGVSIQDLINLPSTSLNPLLLNVGPGTPSATVAPQGFTAWLNANPVLAIAIGAGLLALVIFTSHMGEYK